MKLFTAGLETRTLTQVFERIQPRYVAFDAAYAQSLSVPTFDWCKELCLLCTITNLDDDTKRKGKITRFITALKNTPEITQVVLPETLRIDDDSYTKIAPLLTGKQVFYPASFGKDVVLKGKKSVVKDFMSDNPHIRTQRRKMHLTSAFGTDFTDLPLYSADSSLWRRGAEYGAVLDYTDTLHLTRICNGDERNKKELIRAVEHKILAHGFSASLIYESNGLEIASWNMYCQTLLANDLYVKKLGQEYFYTDKDRKRIINEFR